MELLLGRTESTVSAAAAAAAAGTNTHGEYM